MASALLKIRVVLSPDPAGGYTVTSPDLPELLTEGDDAAEALANLPDALAAVRELYIDLNRPFPPGLAPLPTTTPVVFETLVEAA